MKVKNNKYIWLVDYKKATECVGGKFGHNCEFNFLPHFKKIETMGAIITINDYYSITLNMPDIISWDHREILTYCLTKLPGCSSASYDKKKNKLHLEWHY